MPAHPLDELIVRARRLAALGDPARLRIVDELARSDRSPSELQRSLGVTSNLLAHHLDVLEAAGLVSRHPSSGDRRRRYVRLEPSALAHLLPGGSIDREPALFVCTHNSARSQLAAALWRALADAPADSAGTHPADRVHPGAVGAARRAGLDLTGASPKRLVDLASPPALVITVCDRAHEELDPGGRWLHWSVADPVVADDPAAFDATVVSLRARMLAALAPSGR